MIMKTTVLFEEKQGFKQWWIWAILGTINLIFSAGMVQQIILGQPFGNNPMSDMGLIVFWFAFIVFTVLMARVKLYTRIAPEGIYVKPPFFSKYRFYKWSDIKTFSVRRYSALREFGGWGIRYGSGGTAYNMYGQYGLQLELNSHQKVLIGTNRQDELQVILKQMNPAA